jgi:hypothetical protein
MYMKNGIAGQELRTQLSHPIFTLFGDLVKAITDCINVTVHGYEFLLKV